MADVVDHAQDLSERERQAILVRRRRTPAAAAPAEPDRVCLGCGETIPAARLAALPQATHCVECAEVVMGVRR